MKTIQSNKYYSLHSLCNGKTNCTLFFIPGGPGLTPNCFSPFAKKYLSSYKVIGFNFKGTGKPSMKSWVKYFDLEISKHPNCIVIGHSFGGMLCLSSKKIAKLAKGLVLLNTSPNMDWQKNLSKFKISSSDKQEMVKADAIYSQYKTQASLRKLWSSWAPYYFQPRNIKYGKKWLSKQSYIVDAFESSQKVLKNYKVESLPAIRTLILSG